MGKLTGLQRPGGDTGGELWINSTPVLVHPERASRGIELYRPGGRLRRAGWVIFSSNPLAIYTIDRFQEFAEKESHGSREQSSDLQFC
jgi:hypothetical protein